jgi:hypothetical protein
LYDRFSKKSLSFTSSLVKIPQRLWFEKRHKAKNQTFSSFLELKAIADFEKPGIPCPPELTFCPLPL